MKATLLPKQALQVLVEQSATVPEGGHVVCAGVWGGGDILVMAQYRPDLHFTAIDSFKGLEEPTELDGNYSKAGMFAYDFDLYLENTRGVKVFNHKMVITKESVKRLDFARIDMLWMDLDHAEPTRAILGHCLNKCTKNAPILTHDYYNEAYPGIKAVCDTFGKWTNLGYTIAKRR